MFLLGRSLEIFEIILFSDFTMLSRMCPITRCSLTITQTIRAPAPHKLVPKNYSIRNYAREPRSRVAARPAPTMWERLMAPAGPNGKLVLFLLTLVYETIFSITTTFISVTKICKKYFSVQPWEGCTSRSFCNGTSCTLLLWYQHQTRDIS